MIKPEKWILGGCSGREVMYKSGGYVADVDTLANARLIVAAQDLLEACKYSLIVFESDNHPDEKVFKLLRSAIAKAKGCHE